MSLFFAGLVRRCALGALAFAALAMAASVPVSAATEVKWSQWKTTEVGEKFMAELKAAFEKDNPDITLTLVDSPFTGFHDKAVVLYQAKKLPDVLLVQVDWVAEFADLGMLEPLDAWIAKEPKSFFDNIPVRLGLRPYRAKSTIAERYHQEYFQNNPNQPYCHYVVAPKVAKFREKFAKRIKK